MLTKGYIIELATKTTNKFRVRIPLFDSAGQDTLTNSDNIVEATLCYDPSSLNSYKVNDCVIIGFENDEESKPIILGKLYTNETKENRGFGNFNTLNVSSSASLPLNSTLGEVDLQTFIDNLKLSKNNSDRIDQISQGSQGDVSKLKEELAEEVTRAKTSENTKVDKEINLADNIDLNTVITSGFYRLQGRVTNAPSGSSPSWGQLLVVRGGGDTIGQFLLPYDDSSIWYRSGNPVNNPLGSFRDWKKLTNIDDLSNSLSNKISYTNNKVTVAGNEKTLAKTSPDALYIPNGLVMGGTALSAGLVTRGICGVITPDATTGACTKDSLYLNYDGNDNYDRKVVLGASVQGDTIADSLNATTFSAIRGDQMIAYVSSSIKTAITDTLNKDV